MAGPGKQRNIFPCAAITFAFGSDTSNDSKILASSSFLTINPAFCARMYKARTSKHISALLKGDVDTVTYLRVPYLQ